MDIDQITRELKRARREAKKSISYYVMVYLNRETGKAWRTYAASEHERVCGKSTELIMIFGGLQKYNLDCDCENVAREMLDEVRFF